MSTVRAHQRKEEPLIVLQLAKSYLRKIANFINDQQYCPKQVRWQYAVKLNELAQLIVFGIGGAHDVESNVENREDFMLMRERTQSALQAIKNSLDLLDVIDYYNPKTPRKELDDLIEELGTLQVKVRNWLKISLSHYQYLLS